MFRLTVREISPDSVYEGTVYTQTVTGDLEDGTRIEFEDPTCAFEGSDIGESVRAELRAQSAHEAEAQSTETTAVLPTATGNVDLHGRVVAVSDDAEHPLELDVGTGTLLADAENSQTVGAGDWVTVVGARLFLGEVARGSDEAE
jgi:hypothetical protein